MGLDWFPSNRPKRGHEVEFGQLISLDLSELDGPRRAQAEARFRAISESAFEVVRGEMDGPALMFRGERLREAVEVIGDRLLDRAWEPQSAHELAAYGEALLAAASSFARKQRLDWAELNEMPEAAGSNKSDQRAAACRLTVQAARWCLWWSAKGFGLFPEY